MHPPSHLALWPLVAVGLAACGDAKQPPTPVSLVPPVGVSAPGSLAASPPAPEAASAHPSQPVAKIPPQPLAQAERDLYAAMQSRAEQGDVEARFEVAMMHLLGRGGVTKDRDLAIEMLKRASDDGSRRAMTNLANLMIETKREQALDLYEQAGAAGDLDARRHAAFLLAYEADGSTPTRDGDRLEKAKRYLKEGAAQGDLFAEALLGELLADLGQTQEALRWLKKPALAGVTNAMERVMTLAVSDPAGVDKALLAKLKAMRKQAEG